MKFRMLGKESEFKTYFIPPHNAEEAAPGARHPEMRDWPLEGFLIYLSTLTLYDTDRDPRLVDENSPWVRNEFKHYACGKGIKKNVENYLLKHPRYRRRFVLDEPQKAPLHFTGDEAAMVRKLLAEEKERQKMEAETKTEKVKVSA